MLRERDSEEVAFEQSERGYRSQGRIEHMERIGAGHSMRWDCEFYEAEWDTSDPVPGTFWYGMDWPEETHADYWHSWSRHWRMYQPIGSGT